MEISITGIQKNLSIQFSYNATLLKAIKTIPHRHWDANNNIRVIPDTQSHQSEILIRNGKDGKDRRTMLPESLNDPLRLHLEKVKRVFEQDKREGWGKIFRSNALGKKYPGSSIDCLWQWVFLQERRWRDNWNERFKVVMSRDYSHIPNSVTFKTNYKDQEFGEITLSVSTKYRYLDFCDFFAKNGFKKVHEQKDLKKRFAYVCFQYYNK